MRHYAVLAIRTAAGAPLDPSHADLLLAALDDHSPIAVEELVDGMRVYFLSAGARDQAAAALGHIPDVHVVAEEVPDENWAERSQAALGPVAVGDLTIAPPWAVAEREPGAGTIVILPSMGFGTAHHASTRLCLRALQALSLADRTVLDAGTGSGVLAIAASRLGAERVVACDVDPDAVASARENLALNDVADRVTLVNADVSRPSTLPARRFDVILANLTAAMLSREAATFAGLAASDATLIASGLQTDDVAPVAAAFADAGWTLHERQDEDGWVGLVFVRHAPPTSPTSSTVR